MAITLNGTTGISNDGGYAGDGVVFADATPANTLVTDASGNVVIATNSTSNTVSIGTGTATARAKLDISNSITTSTQTTGLHLGYSEANFYGFRIVNENNPSITSAGNLLIQYGTTTTWVSSITVDTNGSVLFGKTAASDSGQTGFVVYETGGNKGVVTSTVDAPTGTNSYHLYNINATNNGYRFYVNVNGGIYNFSGNNSNLSDERTKKNIEVSGNYLDKICAIPVKLFNYKDEAEGEQRTLGVIAQDVEAVAPEFVNNNGWEGTTPEDGVPLKSIYSNDMQFALMKCIQELKAIVDAQGAEIAALKGTP